MRASAMHIRVNAVHMHAMQMQYSLMHDSSELSNPRSCYLKDATT